MDVGGVAAVSLRSAGPLHRPVGHHTALHLSRGDAGGWRVSVSMRLSCRSPGTGALRLVQCGCAPRHWGNPSGPVDFGPDHRPARLGVSPGGATRALSRAFF